MRAAIARGPSGLPVAGQRALNTRATRARYNSLACPYRAQRASRVHPRSTGSATAEPDGPRLQRFPDPPPAGRSEEEETTHQESPLPATCAEFASMPAIVIEHRSSNWAKIRPD